MKRQLVAFLILLCSLASDFSWADERPNIVLVMADDHGYGGTGFTGHPFVKTPTEITFDLRENCCDHSAQTVAGSIKLFSLETKPARLAGPALRSSNRLEVSRPVSAR